MAHLLALPAKLHLSGEDYLTVQSIYRGWAFLGGFEIGAVLLTFVWTLQEHDHRQRFTPLFTALSCLVVSLAIFFLFTFPANRATRNWTELPHDWKTVRLHWEYSHAVRALLNLASFCLLLKMLLREAFGH